MARSPSGWTGIRRRSPSRRARRRTGTRRAWRRGTDRTAACGAAGGARRRCGTRGGVPRRTGATGGQTRAARASPSAGQPRRWRRMPSASRRTRLASASSARARSGEAADLVALALQLRDQFGHAVGGVGRADGIVVDVRVEVAAVGVVRLDEGVVADGRIVVLVVGAGVAGVDEPGQDLELTGVGVPAGVARPGDAVVTIQTPGSTGSDVGRIDEVRGDPAGQRLCLGDVVERLGDGREGGLHGSVSLIVWIRRPRGHGWAVASVTGCGGAHGAVWSTSGLDRGGGRRTGLVSRPARRQARAWRMTARNPSRAWRRSTRRSRPAASCVSLACRALASCAGGRSTGSWIDASASPDGAKTGGRYGGVR